MNKFIMITKETITSYDGSVSIGKGKLVVAHPDRIITLDRKTAIVQGKRIPEYVCGCSYGYADIELRKYIKPCKFTCHDWEILIMQLETDYHTYTAIGFNPHEMYKKIVKMYNGFSGQKFTTGNFHNAKYDDGFKLVDMYQIRVYKANVELCYSHDDMYGFRDSNDKDCTLCGNYWDLYVSDNPKTFPNKSMK